MLPVFTPLALAPWAAEPTEEQPTIVDTHVDMHSSVSQGPAPVAALAEQNRTDGQPALEEPQPTDLARY
jgi:hypothetical protein